MQVEGQSKPNQVRVDVFPRGSVLMNQLMRILMVEVARVPALKSKLYQANFHTTLSGEAMVWPCSVPLALVAHATFSFMMVLQLSCSLRRKKASA